MNSNARPTAGEFKDNNYRFTSTLMARLDKATHTTNVAFYTTNAVAL